MHGPVMREIEGSMACGNSCDILCRRCELAVPCDAEGRILEEASAAYEDEREDGGQVKGTQEQADAEAQTPEDLQEERYPEKE